MDVKGVDGGREGVLTSLFFLSTHPPFENTVRKEGNILVFVFGLRRNSKKTIKKQSTLQISISRKRGVGTQKLCGYVWWWWCLCADFLLLRFLRVHNTSYMFGGGGRREGGGILIFSCRGRQARRGGVESFFLDTPSHCTLPHFVCVCVCVCPPRRPQMSTPSFGRRYASGRRY